MRVTIAFAVLFIPSLAFAQSVEVQKVIDGDNIVACAHSCQTVRISNIDAPEMPPKSKCQKEERLALDATKRLKAMIQRRSVELRVDARSRDRYGRTLAQTSTFNRDFLKIDNVRTA